MFIPPNFHEHCLTKGLSFQGALETCGRALGKMPIPKNSLVVLWLGLRAFIAVGQGLIRGWGTKILQAMWYGQKKRKKKAYS